MADYRIHLAAWAGELQEVQRLLAEDPTRVNAEGDGWKPIILAARMGHCGVVQVLLEQVSGGAVCAGGGGGHEFWGGVFVGVRCCGVWGVVCPPNALAV